MISNDSHQSTEICDLPLRFSLAYTLYGVSLYFVVFEANPDLWNPPTSYYITTHRTQPSALSCIGPLQIPTSLLNLSKSQHIFFPLVTFSPQTGPSTTIIDTNNPHTFEIVSIHAEEPESGVGSAPKPATACNWMFLANSWSVALSHLDSQSKNISEPPIKVSVRQIRF